MMTKGQSKKRRKVELRTEALEGRNLLAVLPVQGIGSSEIQALLKPVIEMAPRRNLVSVIDGAVQDNPVTITHHAVKAGSFQKRVGNHSATLANLSPSHRDVHVGGKNRSLMRHDRVGNRAAFKVGGLDGKLKSWSVTPESTDIASPDSPAWVSAALVRHRDSFFLCGVTWERIRRDQRICATVESHGAGTVS